MKSLNEWTREELFALPRRDWSDTAPLYNSLLILSTGKAHDSGWSAMAIIGVRNHQPVEICTECSDDIEWKFPPMTGFGPDKRYTYGQMRTDCSLASGALHAWTDDSFFKVGPALSSVAITQVPK